MTENAALNPDQIRAGLKSPIIGRRVLVYQTAASTNDLAWSFVSQPDSHGVCVFAEQQTAGRGRLGRKWLSEKGRSLLFSVLLMECPAAAETLTLAAAVAVADCMSKLSTARVLIKWPNDVLLNDKKGCGILVESRRTQAATCYVIGIGINVSQNAGFFDRLELDQPATGLELETGKSVDRNELAARILAELDHRIQQAARDPQAVVTDWKHYNHQIGQRIALRQADKEYRGTCLDIDPLEGLIVQLDRGPIQLFTASQTTVIQS